MLLIRKELQEALKSAYEDRGCFQLLDVLIDKEVLSNKLTGFVKGIYRMRAQAATSFAECN